MYGYYRGKLRVNHFWLRLSLTYRVKLTKKIMVCRFSADDGKLYLWGKNASQIIRMDESSRFFQFEPFHVSLGTWTALKV